jgi:endonuclease YncB( thermonuclease family)
MMFMKGMRSFFLVFIIVLGIKSMMVNGWEINETTSVTKVIDGDTFYIQNDRVRLADINAPENGTEPDSP